MLFALMTFEHMRSSSSYVFLIVPRIVFFFFLFKYLRAFIIVQDISLENPCALTFPSLMWNVLL